MSDWSTRLPAKSLPFAMHLAWFCRMRALSALRNSKDRGETGFHLRGNLCVGLCFKSHSLSKPLSSKDSLNSTALHLSRPDWKSLSSRTHDSRFLHCTNDWIHARNPGCDASANEKHLVKKLWMDWFRTYLEMCQSVRVSPTAATAKHIKEIIRLVFKPVRLGCGGLTPALDLLWSQLANVIKLCPVSVWIWLDLKLILGYQRLSLFVVCAAVTFLLRETTYNF